MENLVVSINDSIHRVYVLDGGGKSSPQLSLSDQMTQTIVVEKDAKADIVILIMPGAS